MDKDYKNEKQHKINDNKEKDDDGDDNLEEDYLHQDDPVYGKYIYISKRYIFQKNV